MWENSIIIIHGDHGSRIRIRRPIYANRKEISNEDLRDSYSTLFAAKIPDEKSLENTIVHELIHMRFPYMSHGKRFNKLIRQGLKGKSFLPYKKRK